MKIRKIRSLILILFLAIPIPFVFVYLAMRSTPSQSVESKSEVLASKNIGTTQTVAILPQIECNTSKVSVFAYESGSTDPQLIQSNIGYINNKFGLYIYSLKDYIATADDLVNSNGGSWGYVLIPYNVRDHDEDKWRSIFKMLREKELIPIIQLWDVDLVDFRKETDEAVDFLDKQDWPIDKRYISVYNEPNDERFWKGRLDPSGYAEILDYTITAFKTENPNFYMMNGAFNATAPSHSGYLDQFSYMYQMNQKIPGIFTKLDGWASHSYPQPGYLGTPNDTGRGSIRTYEWELEILRNNFGLDRDLPVFITETGWPHSEGAELNPAYYDSKKVAEYYSRAFQEVWLPDPRVVAVTPFTVYYEKPDDHFNWIHQDGRKVFPQYTAIQQIKKISGDPTRLVKKDTLVQSCE